MPPADQQREMVLARLADHLLATGLAKASLRELASAAGVSDRMLLYYFADKAEVLAGACAAVAAGVAGQLAGAIPQGTRLPPVALMRAAATLTTGPAMRPFMRLWVEIVAAAAKGEQPFDSIAATVLDGFLGWARTHLDPGDDPDPEALAALVVATIDGLALIDICRSDDLVARAATRIGPVHGTGPHGTGKD
jgi:AcrR family transcriptional regulator